MQTGSLFTLPWTKAKAPPEQVSGELVSYAPCPHCGFHLAELRPASLLAAARADVSCPICGLRACDSAKQPGANLSDHERAERLTRWLQDHGYDPERVYKRWGFRVADFFA